MVGVFPDASSPIADGGGGGNAAGMEGSPSASSCSVSERISAMSDAVTLHLMLEYRTLAVGLREASSYDLSRKDEANFSAKRVLDEGGEHQVPLTEPFFVRVAAGLAALWREAVQTASPPPKVPPD